MYPPIPFSMTATLTASSLPQAVSGPYPLDLRKALLCRGLSDANQQRLKMDFFHFVPFVMVSIEYMFDFVNTFFERLFLFG